MQVAMLAQAQAQDIPPADQADAGYFPLVVPVLDVDAPVGTAAVQVNRAGDVRIARDTLMPILERVIGKDGAARYANALASSDIVDANVARLAGFTMRFDLKQVALVLQMPVDNRSSIELALADPPRTPEASQSRQVPAGFSAYTNFAFALIDDPAITSGGRRGTLQMQSAIRFSGFVLENEMSVETGSGASKSFSRMGTRLSRDFPALGIRASAGDIFTVSRGFLQSEDMVGISVFKNVEVFNPFVAARPTGRQSFRLDRSASVDIYVNEQLVRQVRLGPGNYDLTNFAQLEGANDVRIETRDDLGETRSYDFTSFFDSDLLAPKLSEWQVNAGFAAARFDRQIKYRFSEPVASGFYRRGINNTLTLGASAEVRDYRQMVGVEAVSANGFANISFDLAAAHTDGAVGAAAAITLQPRLPKGIDAPDRTVDLFAELATDGFGNNPFNGLGKSIRTGFRYSDLFGGKRFSLSIAGTFTAAENTRTHGYDLTASVGYRANNGFIFRATPSYRQSLDGRRETAIRFSLTKTFGPKSRARATYDTRENRMLAEYDYISQFGGIGTFGANVVASRADNEKGSVTANASYIGNRFEANVGYSQLVEGSNGFQRGRTNVVVETSVGFADGQFAIGRPVSDAFAIVDTHENLGKRQVIVDPGANDRGDRARSGALGPALVSDLGSYNISRLGVAVDDLPVGYDLGTGILEYFAPYRGGYASEVGSGRNASAFGLAMATDGQPLGLARGIATSVDDADFGEQPVFTNRAGRFGLLGLVPGKTYKVIFSEGGISFVIKVPSDATGLVNVGTVKAEGGAGK
jgi:outer membrane usher protein